MDSVKANSLGYYKLRLKPYDACIKSEQPRTPHFAYLLIISK